LQELEIVSITEGGKNGLKVRLLLKSVGVEEEERDTNLAGVLRLTTPTHTTNKHTQHTK